MYALVISNSLAEVMTEASLEKLDANDGLPDDHPGKHKYSDEDYEHAVKINLPVAVGKVDCVTHKKVCNELQNIRAYPTLRLFIDGKVWGAGSDYKGHRTVIEMVDWLVHMEEEHKKILEMKDNMGEMARNLHVAHESKSSTIVNISFFWFGPCQLLTDFVSLIFYDNRCQSIPRYR